MKQKIGIIRHPTVDFELPPLRAAREFLANASVELWEAERGSLIGGQQGELIDTTLLLTAGGDGTLLYGARLAAPVGIPLLGVNLGRLGFLTELEADQLTMGLERFLRGDYWIEQRGLLRTEKSRGEEVLTEGVALNEVLISREVTGQLVRLRVLTDDQEVGVFDSDGVVVATATGSTAYALAAGGPVLDPMVEGVVLVPLNPFALTVRPIVFPAGQELWIELLHRDAVLAMDGGQLCPLRAGERVHIQTAAHPLKLVRLTERDHFYISLREKLGWGLPLVPTI